MGVAAARREKQINIRMTSADDARLKELHHRTMPLLPAATFGLALLRAGMRAVEQDEHVLLDAWADAPKEPT